MTYLEVLWMDTTVMVVSIMSKSGKIHGYVKPYIGKTGKVVCESKNNMLLIEFKSKTGNYRYRAIPPGCVIQLLANTNE